MNINTKKIAVMAIFAALYAVGVIYLAFMSFGPIQVRIADAMLPLSMIFGLPSALGLTLGCFVSSVYGSPYGPIDIVGGSIANFVACVLAWYIGRKGGRIQRFAGTIVQSVVISLIVGIYLGPLANVPVLLSVAGLLAGEVVAINIIGFPLQEAVRRSGIIQRLNF